MKLIKLISTLFMIFYVLTFICVIVFGLLVIVTPFSEKVRQEVSGIPVIVTQNVPGVEVKLSGRTLEGTSLSTSGILEVEDAPFWIPMTNSLYTFVIMLLALLALGRINRIIDSVEKRKFFSAANARRLKQLGTLLLGGAVFGILVMVILYFVLNGKVELDGLERLSPLPLVSEHLPLLLGGFFIYIIAIVFGRGVELQEENESIV